MQCVKRKVKIATLWHGRRFTLTCSYASIAWLNDHCRRLARPPTTLRPRHRDIDCSRRRPSTRSTEWSRLPSCTVVEWPGCIMARKHCYHATWITATVHAVETDRRDTYDHIRCRAPSEWLPRSMPCCPTHITLSLLAERRPRAHEFNIHTCMLLSFTS